MTRPNITSIKVALISALLMGGLMANPARADHNERYIAPLATFVLLNALFRNGHQHHYGYSRHRHGHGHYYSRRGYSQSYGGYSHKSKRIYSRRDHRG
ncbi:MAG: hypothetical protein IIC58_07890 [Proteobacteria bacterium]|nr:hypothetical protein [Pseudomonadota bacterium]